MASGKWQKCQYMAWSLDFNYIVFWCRIEFVMVSSSQSKWINLYSCQNLVCRCHSINLSSSHNCNYFLCPFEWEWQLGWWLSNLDSSPFREIWHKFVYTHSKYVGFIFIGNSCCDTTHAKNIMKILRFASSIYNIHLEIFTKYFCYTRQFI